MLPRTNQPCASRGVVSPRVVALRCVRHPTWHLPTRRFHVVDADGAVAPMTEVAQVVSTPPGAPMEKALLAECNFRLIKECTFTADQPSYSCQNNLLIRCSEVGAWVIDLDCSAEGKECRNAQCVSK